MANPTYTEYTTLSIANPRSEPKLFELADGESGRYNVNILVDDGWVLQQSSAQLLEQINMLWISSGGGTFFQLDVLNATWVPGRTVVRVTCVWRRVQQPSTATGNGDSGGDGGLEYGEATGIAQDKLRYEIWPLSLQMDYACVGPDPMVRLVTYLVDRNNIGHAVDSLW